MDYTPEYYLALLSSNRHPLLTTKGWPPFRRFFHPGNTHPGNTQICSKCHGDKQLWNTNIRMMEDCLECHGEGKVEETILWAQVETSYILKPRDDAEEFRKLYLCDPVSE